MTEHITGTTMLTGLLGSPVAHSLSPLMHNESFRWKVFGPWAQEDGI